MGVFLRKCCPKKKLFLDNSDRCPILNIGV
jgi:hypothetical protein